MLSEIRRDQAGRCSWPPRARRRRDPQLVLSAEPAGLRREAGPSRRALPLITVGRHDWVTPVASSETIAALIPDSQLVIFEKSGHSPPSDEPELFRRVVRDFLAEVAPEA